MVRVHPQADEKPPRGVPANRPFPRSARAPCARSTAKTLAGREVVDRADPPDRARRDDAPAARRDQREDHPRQGLVESMKDAAQSPGPARGVRRAGDALDAPGEDHGLRARQAKRPEAGECRLRPGLRRTGDGRRGSAAVTSTSLYKLPAWKREGCCTGQRASSRSGSSSALHDRAAAAHPEALALRHARRDDQDVSGDRDPGGRIPARVHRAPEAVSRRGAAASPSQVVRTRRSSAELGKPLDAIFSEFEEQPIASASLAQVHRARLTQAGARWRSRSSTRTSRTSSARTSRTCERVCRVYEFFDPQPLALLPLLTELTTHLGYELDFRREAECGRAGARALRRRTSTS